MFKIRCVPQPTNSSERFPHMMCGRVLVFKLFCEEMFALKKRASKGRGRGRGRKSGGSSSDMFTLQSSAKKKTKAERRILNEFEKGEVGV